MNRTTRIYLRVSPQEKLKIAARAKERGRQIGALLRELGLVGMTQVTPSINPIHWAKLSASVSNLNQSVRICNHLINAKAPISTFPNLIPFILAVKADVDEIRADLKAQRGTDCDR